MIFFSPNLAWVYSKQFIWNNISSYNHCIFEYLCFILNWPPQLCSGPCPPLSLTKSLWWYRLKNLIRMSSTLSYLQLPFLMLLVIPQSSRGFYFMLLGLNKAVVGSEDLSFPISCWISHYFSEVWARMSTCSLLPPQSVTLQERSVALFSKL